MTSFLSLLVTILTILLAIKAWGIILVVILNKFLIKDPKAKRGLSVFLTKTLEGSISKLAIILITVTMLLVHKEGLWLGRNLNTLLLLVLVFLPASFYLVGLIKSRVKGK